MLPTTTAREQHHGEATEQERRVAAHGAAAARGRPAHTGATVVDAVEARRARLVRIARGGALRIGVDGAAQARDAVAVAGARGTEAAGDVVARLAEPADAVRVVAARLPVRARADDVHVHRRR